MKFLLDMPVSPLTAEWLKEHGHEAVHAFSLGLGRASDQEILERAVQEERIVVTADTDFPHLLALSRKTSPGVILFRGGDYTQQETEELLSRVLGTIPEEMLTCSICVVDRRRIRCRPLPIK